MPGTVMLADSIHNLSPFLIRFSENFGIRWYGLSYVIAFVVGFSIGQSRFRILLRLLVCEQVQHFAGDFRIHRRATGADFQNRFSDAFDR